MFRPTSPFNVTTAKALYQAGLEAIRTGQSSIDLSDVAQADSSTVAALVAWQRAALRQGGGLTLLNAPSNLRNLANLYGVAELLLDVSAKPE